MTVKTGDRIPPEDLEAIMARALDGLDFEHDSSWLRPESCPCHDHGLCCLVPMPAEHGRCQGHVIEVPTSPEHVVNLAILTAALPEPDNAGTVGAREAALSVLSVIQARLVPAYSLRADRLVQRLTEVSGDYELAHGQQQSPDAIPIPDSALPMRCCAQCGEPYRPKRASSVYCGQNCRQSAYRARQGVVTARR